MTFNIWPADCGFEPVYQSSWGESYPFISDVKKTDDFVWSDAADKVFEDFKRQLAEPPVLAAPVEKEP